MSTSKQYEFRRLLASALLVVRVADDQRGREQTALDRLAVDETEAELMASAVRFSAALVDPEGESKWLSDHANHAADGVEAMAARKGIAWGGPEAVKLALEGAEAEERKREAVTAAQEAREETEEKKPRKPRRARSAASTLPGMGEQSAAAGSSGAGVGEQGPPRVPGEAAPDVPDPGGAPPGWDGTDDDEPAERLDPTLNASPEERRAAANGGAA